MTVVAAKPVSKVVCATGEDRSSAEGTSWPLELAGKLPSPGDSVVQRVALVGEQSEMGKFGFGRVDDADFLNPVDPSRLLYTAYVPSHLQQVRPERRLAAKLVGEAADISRSRTGAAYAMWAGTAPIRVWSANNQRFRLNRGGNRQTNAAIHRIAITQIRIHPDAQTFITRRLESGSTKREALRLLRRKLANIVYRSLLIDIQQPALGDGA